MSSSNPKTQQKNEEVLRYIPINRILVESDVSHPNNVIIGTFGAMDYVANVLNKPLEETVSLVAKNSVGFLTTVENTEIGVSNPIRILEITVANLMMITAGDKHK